MLGIILLISKLQEITAQRDLPVKHRGFVSQLILDSPKPSLKAAQGRDVKVPLDIMPFIQANDVTLLCLK